MRIGVRVLRKETVSWLDRALAAGSLTRSRMSRELCERESWRNHNGELCAASARRALPRLALRLGRDLPPAQAQPPGRRQAEPDSGPAVEFEGRLQDLGALRMRPVGTPEQRRLWRSMLVTHHPLGDTRAPGKRLAYLIDTQRLGVVGGLSFVAAPMRLGPRDEAIGWSWRAHGANLERVVSNDRFLIQTGVRVPNLASCVLGRAVRRLPSDWKREHGLKPLLPETCVHPRYAGSSYAAAGWTMAGETAGRAGRGKRKRVWLRGLGRGWKRDLQREPERPLGRFPPLRPMALTKRKNLFFS